MSTEQPAAKKEIVITPAIIGYELNSRQYVLSNYLVPAFVLCIFYILHFAGEIAVAYRHFRESNTAWGSLTIFFMYLPVIGSYILTISLWELWPELEGCGLANLKWFALKTLAHIFFPIWSMWRHAEKMFWSIEGYRAANDEEREEIIATLNSPRTIELYYFLQGYLQAPIQILFQLHLLWRHGHYFDEATIDAEVLCIVFSLAVMAKVTTQYQRFKTQKIGGRNYPWLKSDKLLLHVVDSPQRSPTIVYRCKPTDSKAVNNVSRRTYIDDITLREHDELPEASRRSSDFYELPNSIIELKVDRETSIVDGPPRVVLTDLDMTDFKPKRLHHIKALPEDDTVGKFIMFLWWFCFLLARMLAISSFAYFYFKETVYILSGHFILIIVLLLYDVRVVEVQRAKAFFFIFIGWVYLFCLIEFKIRFKKAKFMYRLFFILTVLENFIMMSVWWHKDTEDLENDWWFRYTYYMIMGCTFLSMISRLMYLKFLSPKKVVIDSVTEE